MKKLYNITIKLSSIIIRVALLAGAAGLAGHFIVESIKEFIKH